MYEIDILSLFHTLTVSQLHPRFHLLQTLVQSRLVPLQRMSG